MSRAAWQAPPDGTSDVLARAGSAQVFQDGPFSAALARLPGARTSTHGLEQQAAALAAIAWLPLLACAFVQDGLRYGASTSAFLADFGAHARCLVTLPLLVMADRFCGSRLTAVARHFGEAGMVEAAHRTRYEALLALARRRCRSGWMAVAVVIATGVLVASLVALIPAREFPAWHGLADPRAPSLAGWWHVVVSTPLLVALALGWLWRLAVWAWFLWRIANLPIRLCAAHPDRAAGLKFTGFSVRAFAILGTALGALLAGRIANHVLDGEKLADYGTTAGTAIAVALIVFGVPLLAFTPRLMREWREGVATYGRLAEEVGFRFEDKWFRAGRPVDPDALEATDFSAAVDLAGYVSNVYDMRVYPGDVKSFVALAVATAFPLIPLVVIAAPFDVLMKSLAGLLF